MQTSQESYKDISLSPSSADRIAVFVGELNGNIKLIEKTFSVKIFHKGDNIKITGDAKDTKYAAKAIKDLYGLTNKNLELTKETVHLCIQSYHNLRLADKEDKFMEEIVIQTPKKLIKSRSKNQQDYLKNIKKYIDMTICLFNFEHTFYKENNHKSMHLGHPFVDLKEAHKDDVIKKYELNAAKKYISVLPGSRPSEIKNMMPIYLDAMKDIKKINDDYFFLIPAADHELKEQISNYVGDLGNTIIEVNAANDFLSLSDYSIVTSGTASLQAAVLNSFPIICYKTNFISYSIISRLLTIDMVGLPNLLIGKKVFPELIQDQCKSNQILNEITNINHNSNFINYKSLNIQGLLKGSGFERVSNQIISLLN